MNSITQDINFRQSVVKYSLKHGVTAASIVYKLHQKMIYRWREKYDGTLKSLANKSRRTHRSPNAHIEEEIKKTMFENKLEELGIKHKLIKPYTPRHNGKVERSHRKDFITIKYFVVLNI